MDIYRCGVVLFAVLTLSVGLAAAGQPADLEIWLAATGQCNSCGIYERAAKQRGYGDTLHYRHADRELEIPIRKVRKAALAPAILTQLTGDAGPQSPHWPLQLAILVVQGGKVLSFGNIADSADIREARFSDAQMLPPAHPPPDHPSLRSGDEYQRFFRENWNLEYFVAIALGDAQPRKKVALVDLDSSTPARLANRNVILWGAAENPLHNALFVPHRMQEIATTLRSELSAAPPRFTTLFAGGPDSTANDTSVEDDDVTHFIHAGLPADFAATPEGASSVLSAIKHSRNSHNLLIHVGHSGPDGMPLWGHLSTLSAENLAAVTADSTNSIVMISGGCNGGLFARAVQCGFFAAHPDVLASGCQRSANAIENSNDYLRLFFGGMKNKGADVDTDADGEITFSEAHWYASVRMEDYSISYTTVDALADAYFAADMSRLPRSMKVAEARKLAAHATAEEQHALELLTAKSKASQAIDLRGFVELNHRTESKLAKFAEASSAQRNARMALPYKLMLPALVRRLMYLSADASDPELQRVEQCERQSPAAFLAN